MSRLSQFKKNNFLDKITLLNQVAIDGTDIEIDELIALSSAPSGDSTVDVMITHTLRDLLMKNEAATVELLGSTRKDHIQLALGIISRQKYMSAAERLSSLYFSQRDPLFKNEMLQTMMDLDPGLFAELFKTEIRNPDNLLAATAIKAIALSGDSSQNDYLRQLIQDNENPDRYHSCAITTAQAIETLAALNGDDNLRFLCRYIHHKNPTARRFIQEQLAQIGDSVIPFLSSIFNEGNTDQKILAANLLALIKGKLGGDLLLSALDQGQAEDPNVRFAVYEALGSFPSMKTFVCLIEALSQTDHLILISVLSALNRYDFPFVADKVSEQINMETDQGRTIINAMIDSESDALIRKLFPISRLTEAIKQALFQAAQSRSSAVIESLCTELINSNEPCKKDSGSKSSGARILAADDSMAIRKFYESILSSAGYQVFTAEDGLLAFTKLQFDRYDLLITDLNMPNMDGIELAGRVRGEESFNKMPIIMVTTESEQSQRKLAEQQRIDAYVNKPIKAELLLQAIRDLGI